MHPDECACGFKISKHTQEDRIYRSDNQSLFHRTPPSLHVGNHLHSRPIYSLQRQSEEDERSARAQAGESRSGGERRYKFLSALQSVVMPVQHFLANLIEKKQRVVRGWQEKRRQGR